MAKTSVFCERAPGLRHLECAFEPEALGKTGERVCHLNCLAMISALPHAVFGPRGEAPDHFRDMRRRGCILP